MTRFIRPRLAIRYPTILLLLASTTGCGAGWRSVSPSNEQVVPASKQAQIWTDHRVLRVHGLHVSPDSVSGIPYLIPLACDSCRLSFPRAQVDSLRVGDPTGGFWRSVGLALAGLLLSAFVLCAVDQGCGST